MQGLTIEELEYLIEQKVLEILGDPDYGLELKGEFKEKLKERLTTSKGIPHKEVIGKNSFTR